VTALHWTVQFDTTNVLFICGGAFIDLDRQVAERTATSSIGFGNPVRARGPARGAEHVSSQVLKQVEHADSIQYGLHPGVCGPLPRHLQPPGAHHHSSLALLCGFFLGVTASPWQWLICNAVLLQFQVTAFLLVH